MKHGRGTETFANGDQYCGEYNKGAPNGQGTYKWKNGSIYVGDFVKGLKHGFGKWKKEAEAIITNTYEGEYKYD